MEHTYTYIINKARTLEPAPKSKLMLTFIAHIKNSSIIYKSNQNNYRKSRNFANLVFYTLSVVINTRVLLNGTRFIADINAS